MRSKAEFRAIREQIGMTQAALADELGVEIRSVKRWEKPSPDGWYQPPQDAWDVLDAALEQQHRIVDAAIAKVDEIMASMGSLPEAVELKYWLSESDYVSWSTDADYGIDGDWRMANANTRACATVLRLRGIAVRFVSGAGNVIS